MKTHSDSKITKDTPFQGLACNGFLMIFVSILLFAAAIFFVYITDTYEPEVIGSAVYGILCTSAILLFIISPVLLIGLMILEPNQARAMVFFGKYRGTFSRTGFFWVNPFGGHSPAPASSGSIPSTPRRKSHSAPATSTWTPSRSMTATATPSSSASSSYGR